MAIKIDDWIRENEASFLPPVCNKCMYADQLKVFFVGGPNSRADYHLEEGEELFYQRKGAMNLKVIEHGIARDLIINEGELFLLPSRVEHSPQRMENTIGLVIERERANTEFDCVRYFCNDSNKRLFERWFHLKDVVKDLPPLIKCFMNSEEHKTGFPGEKSFIVNAPFEPRDITLPKPFDLHTYIKSQEQNLKSGRVQVFPDTFTTKVFLYGQAEYDLENPDGEILLWTQPDSLASVGNVKLHSDSLHRLPASSQTRLVVEHGHVISIQMS